VGLDNVERRLAGHYGPAASVTLSVDDTGGTLAELLLPLLDVPLADEDLHAEALARRAGG
jgi:hypothetical protein